ncbi:MAG: hypothetical protein ACLR56_15240 [Oscillospiraceae bacterium]
MWILMPSDRRFCGNHRDTAKCGILQRFDAASVRTVIVLLFRGLWF